MEGQAETRTNHPYFAHLLRLWKDMKAHGSTAPEWLNFWNFFEWAISNGWEPGCVIRRFESKEPKCPENCYLDFGERKPINLDEVEVKGGYKNSPCHACDKALGEYCTYYKTCLQYRAWLHHSWKDFREAALVKYGKTTID